MGHEERGLGLLRSPGSRGPASVPSWSPADLLEDVVSADVLDVFLYYRAYPIFLCQLLLQPLYQVLVVVPNVGLWTDNSCLKSMGARPGCPECSASGNSTAHTGGMQVGEGALPALALGVRVCDRG